MNNKRKNLRQQYDEIIVPKELESMLKKTIEAERIKVGKGNRMIKVAVAAAVLVCVGFTGACNLSTSFAQSVADMPVIGHLARLVTFVDAHEDDGILTVDMKVPAITGIDDKVLEKKLNVAIMERVDAHVAEAKVRAKEYKEAFVATGGNPDDFHDLTLNVSYELLYQDDSSISFKLSMIESMAAVYSAEKYYTIDLVNNREIGLEDLLGNDYKEVIASQVKNQIYSLTEEEKAKFFMDDVDNLVIEDNQAFYLNKDGKIIVVFPKYALASGAAGQQEFVIEK